MGMSLMSSSPCTPPSPVEPNPRVFSLKELEGYGRFTIALIHYPIARFRPTLEGWAMARNLCRVETHGG